MNTNTALLDLSPEVMNALVTDRAARTALAPAPAADIDSDTETDSDTDTDSDTETDSDTDTDSYTAAAALQLAAPTAQRPTQSVAIIDELLRDRAAILARIRTGVGLTDLVRTMLITIAVAGAIFGAVLGSYRGGAQIAYAAIKLPLVLLLTAALCAPCLSAFNAALDRPSSLRRDVALVLTALAFGSLLLVAQAPLLLLVSMLGAGYHTSILLTCACAALAGLASLILLGRGVRAHSPRHARTASLALVLVFAVVGAQMAWTLRPYLVRPRTPDVPFVRSIEGSFLESVLTSMNSARGHYHRDLAPVPGEDLP